MIHDEQDFWGLPDPVAQSGFYDAVPTKRLIAFVIDLFISAVLAAIILPLTAFLGLFFFPIIVAVIGFAYRVVTIANGSATLGMRMMGIEFRTKTGEKFDLGLAILHTGLFYAACSITIAQVASVVLILTTARKQSLSDIIIGSAVINRASKY